MSDASPSVTDPCLEIDQMLAELWDKFKVEPTEWLWPVPAWYYWQMRLEELPPIDIALVLAGNSFEICAPVDWLGRLLMKFRMKKLLRWWRNL